MLFKLLIFTLVATSLLVESKKKKVVLTWESVSSCPGFDNKFTDLSDVNLYMYNESAIKMKGIVEIKENVLKRPFVVKALAEKLTPVGNYVVILTYEIADFCKEIENPDEDSGLIKPYAGRLKPPMLKCTELKNKYDISDLTPKVMDEVMTSETVGNYRSTVEFLLTLEDGLLERWACYQLFWKLDMA